MISKFDIMSYSILTKNSCPGNLRCVFETSCNIFEFDASAPMEPPFDMNEWMGRLSNSYGEITYSQNNENKEIEAFVFTYRRSADVSQLHIWIAGCREKYRRNKVMFKLFELVEHNAALNGYTSLTVNTYPDKFKNMPAFLNSRNFELISTTPGNAEPGDIGAKLAFRKLLA